MIKKPIFINPEIHELFKKICVNKGLVMGNYVEELIKTSNYYLEYLDKIREDELKNKVFEEYKEKQELGK